MLIITGTWGPATLGAAQLSPGSLDSALFSPLGVTLITLVSSVFLGPLTLGPLASFPNVEVGSLAPVPSGAPLHVFGLLGAGFFDLSGDRDLSLPPLFSLLALALGGLWSRRLGPHREVWSWDVVEVTALDLLASETIGEHL